MKQGVATPRPWKIDPLAVGGILTQEGDTIAQAMQMLPRDEDPFNAIRKANAELIVTAVNAFDELVAALEMVYSSTAVLNHLDRDGIGQIEAALRKAGVK